MKQVFKILKYIFDNNAIHQIPQRLWMAFYYQLIKRLNRSIFSKNLLNGHKIFIFPENPISSAFMYADYPDKKEIDTLRALADPHTVFLDVGANIGAYSIMLLDKVQEIYAFEPHPTTANYCKMNFLLNQTTRAQVITKAIGATNSLRYFSNMSRGSPINAFVQQDNEAIQVQTITLDQFAQTYSFSKNANFIIKIDVEGFEHEVIQGGQAFLSQSPIKAILFETFSENFAEIDQILTKLGFHIQHIDNHNVIAIHHDWTFKAKAVPIHKEIIKTQWNANMRSQSFKPQQWMDHFLTWYRHKKIFTALKKNQSIRTIYDMGCGQGRLVHRLYQLGFDAYGFDVRAGKRVIACDLNHCLPLENESVDMVSSLANLEHLHEPLLNLKETYRVLKKGGVLILTTPSTAAKPILEWMAFKLKIIDPTEILDHKRYFSKKMLEQYLTDAGFKNFKVKRFQMGLNLYAMATK